MNHASPDFTQLGFAVLRISHGLMWIPQGAVKRSTCLVLPTGEMAK